jgi:hypothetical protein
MEATISSIWSEVEETWPKNLYKEFSVEIQEAGLDIQKMKTLVETTQHGLETRLAAVDARAEHGPFSSTGTGVGGVKPPKFDRSACSTAILRLCQSTTGYDTKKSMYLLAILQGWTAKVLHDFSMGAAYEETTGAFEDCCGDHHLSAEYHFQLERRTQLW